MQVRYGWLRQGLALLFALMLGIVLAEPARAQEAGAGETNAPDAVSVVVSGQVRLGNTGEAGVIVEALSIFGGSVIASTVTDSQGRYSLNTGSSQAFRIVPRKGVFEFTPASNTFLLATNNITLNYAMTRPPIVIMGGYTPMGIPQSKCPQRRLNNTTYNPGACGEDEFADLLSDLRGAGWNVRTVMMNSSILGTPSLVNQTSALRRAINDARAVTGARKAIVFAHSTGGPVVRRYMESTLYAGDVSHFFSFGSQHMGNPVESIADEWFAQIMPAYLRATGIVPDFLIPLMVAAIDNTIKDKVNFLCTTTLRTYSILFFGTFSIPGPGQTVLCETSVSGMANFNQSFRPRAGVRYHLVHAANVRLSDMNALGRAMTAAIPGLDDTLIQTNSTTGFLLNGPHDRLITRDPHMTMTSVGERYYLNTNGAFDSAYVRCIRPMFITRTLSEPNCGTFSGAREGERVFSAEEESAALAAITAAEDGATEQKISLRTGNLPDTTTLITHTIPLFEGGSATFLANWITDTVDFSVVDPLGTIYTATSVDANVEYAGDDSRASYVFTSTLTGDYTIQLQATEVITGGVDVSYYAAFESEYTLTTTRSRNWMPPGGAITITALFTGPTPIANPQVEAILSGSSGVTGTVSLSPVGDGRFVYVYTAPDAPGYLEMAIVATGEVNNVPIERSDDLSFTIYPDSFRPSGVYTESVNFAGLTVDVGILVTPGVSGDFRVTGILVDGEGNFIAVATADATAPEDATAMSVSLLFDGAELYAAGDAGPFLVRRLLVIDEREHQQVSADEFDVYTTSAVDLMQFAPERIYLPSVMQ
jgi:pimeloyl-ACP methyl ester carboxylesterase